MTQSEQAERERLRELLEMAYCHARDLPDKTAYSRWKILYLHYRPIVGRITFQLKVVTGSHHYRFIWEDEP